MNAQELRLGNYVMIHDYAKGNRQQVVDQLGSCYVNILDEQYCTPIPLTEEWLLKFGFKKMKNYLKKSTGLSSYSWYKNNTHFFTIEKHDEYDFGDTWIPTFRFDNCITTIDYVHQLQNLYYSIRREELTIKQ